MNVTLALINKNIYILPINFILKLYLFLNPIEINIILFLNLFYKIKHYFVFKSYKTRYYSPKVL
jgi:hypothetical protein